MAENLLAATRVATALFERDGPYLPDGGGLRIRLLPPSRNHPKGARLAEYHYKVKDAAGVFRHGSIGLGTIGEQFIDAATGTTRKFTLADARQSRDKARSLVAQGIDPAEAGRLAKLERIELQRDRLAELDGRRTVAVAFTRWTELYLSAHRKDGGLYVVALFDRHILPTIGDLPIDSLRLAHITDVVDAVTAQGLRRTANVARALLRQFAQWCVARGWLAADPTAGFTQAQAGGKEKARKRNLSALEIIELRDRLPASALPDRIVAAVWVLLACGVRVGELSGAKAADVDLEGGTWLLPETKNGDAHVVHLSAFARRHLVQLLELRSDSEFLLPGRNGGALGDKAITKMIGDRQRLVPLQGRTKQAATLLLAQGRWVPHDLRRSMASRMRETLRISSDVIERCLNHRPQGIAAVYQIGELLAERKAAFEAWGDELERLMLADASNVTELQRVAA